MSNSWCSENNSRLMPAHRMRPMICVTANEETAFSAKFQLAMSFFSRRNERKNVESPMVRMAAVWAMPISIHELSVPR